MANDRPKSNAPQIIVDDGSERVSIVNKRGEEIGVFYFTPTDTGIIDRYAKMVADFDHIVEPLNSVNIAADGTAAEDDADEMEALHEAERRLYAACNELFAGNFSEAFFGKINPFSPINGHFYVENALNAVGAFISDRFGRETRKINARVEKYTHGYTARTGKHSKGRR